MNLADTANRVIDLARKIREYYETELPKLHPNYPLVGPDDENVPPPPEEKQLSDFLAALSEDLIYQLLLIIFGRGDFDVDDLAGYYSALKGTFGGPQGTASQMMDKAPLADYLSDGLAELQKHKISVDKLPLKKLKVRKR